METGVRSPKEVEWAYMHVHDSAKICAFFNTAVYPVAQYDRTNRDCARRKGSAVKGRVEDLVVLVFLNPSYHSCSQ